MLLQKESEPISRDSSRGLIQSPDATVLNSLRWIQFQTARIPWIHSACISWKTLKKLRLMIDWATLIGVVIAKSQFQQHMVGNDCENMINSVFDQIGSLWRDLDPKIRQTISRGGIELMVSENRICAILFSTTENEKLNQNRKRNRADRENTNTAFVCLHSMNGPIHTLHYVIPLITGRKPVTSDLLYSYNCADLHATSDKNTGNRSLKQY